MQFISIANYSVIASEGCSNNTHEVAITTLKVSGADFVLLKFGFLSTNSV